MTTATFRYIDLASSSSTKPWNKVDADVTSFTQLSRKSDVTNIRGRESEFGVDVSGFAVYQSPAKEKAFTDEEAIRTGYYAEVEALLREKLQGVKKVVFFDHTIRRRDPTAPRGPVQQVHVDQTPKAAVARVRRHVPSAEEAEELLKGRYQIINIWRPIGHPASDHPLAVIDYRSTEKKDMIKVDLLYPKRAEENDDGDDRGKEKRPDAETLKSTEGYEAKGETFAVAPNDGHKFYYYKDMTPDEA